MTGPMDKLQARRTALLWLVLVVAGTGLFAGTVDHPFVYDDLHSIKYNPHLRSLRSVPEYFGNPHTFSSQRGGYMFRPVLLTTYALNYRAGRYADQSADQLVAAGQLDRGVARGGTR